MPLSGLSAGKLMQVMRTSVSPRGLSPSQSFMSGAEGSVYTADAHPADAANAHAPVVSLAQAAEADLREHPQPSVVALAAHVEAIAEEFAASREHDSGRWAAPSGNWHEGLSTRVAETGASRVFPCHLVSPVTPSSPSRMSASGSGEGARTMSHTFCPAIRPTARSVSPDVAKKAKQRWTPPTLRRAVSPRTSGRHQPQQQTTKPKAKSQALAPQPQSWPTPPVWLRDLLEQRTGQQLPTRELEEERLQELQLVQQEREQQLAELQMQQEQLEEELRQHQELQQEQDSEELQHYEQEDEPLQLQQELIQEPEPPPQLQHKPQQLLSPPPLKEHKVVRVSSKVSASSGSRAAPSSSRQAAPKTKPGPGMKPRTGTQHQRTLLRTVSGGGPGASSEPSRGEGPRSGGVEEPDSIAQEGQGWGGYLSATALEGIGSRSTNRTLEPEDGEFTRTMSTARYPERTESKPPPPATAGTTDWLERFRERLQKQMGSSQPGSLFPSEGQSTLVGDEG